MDELEFEFAIAPFLAAAAQFEREGLVFTAMGYIDKALAVEQSWLARLALDTEPYT